MFTGLIEETGTVEWARRSGAGVRLRVACSFAGELEHGESVTLNGACQTVVACDPHGFEVDVVAQTLSLTTLGGLRSGGRVNLERALKLGDRLGGHIVSGHVDGVAEVTAVSRGAGETRVTFELPEGLSRHVVERGSIAMDGVSLTVAEVAGKAVTVALIPETLRATRAGEYRVGSEVNVETDILAKHQERLLAGGDAAGERDESPARAGLTEERLRELGFME